jgi:hypothetical protein
MMKSALAWACVVATVMLLVIHGAEGVASFWVRDVLAATTFVLPVVGLLLAWRAPSR